MLRVVRNPESHVGAMVAFGRMRAFCGEQEIPFWQNNQTKPELMPSPDLMNLPNFAGNEKALVDHFLAFLNNLQGDPSCTQEAILSLVQANDMVHQYFSDQWAEAISNTHTAFSGAITEWRNDYRQMIRRWQEINNDNQGLARAAAASIFHQAHTYANMTVIESLGDKLVIPRYGFPIGMSKLRVTVADSAKRDRSKLYVREEDQFRLQRDSMQAIREYVPGSKIIASGRLVTSKGLLKHWTGSDVSGPDASLGLRGWFVSCPATGNFAYGPDRGVELDPRPAERVEHGEMLFAKHGFTTAAWDPPKISQSYEVVGHLASYSSAFSGQSQEIDSGITNITARYKATGELVLMNSGSHEFGFSVCTKCGYAESEKVDKGNGRENLPKGFAFHSSLFAAEDRHNCWGADESFVLRRQNLAAKQVTNLALFDLSHWLSIPEHVAIANTIAQCLRLAGCHLRQLDIREVSILKATTQPNRTTGCSVILYDSVAGGSGHVYEMLTSLGRSWWEEAANLLSVPGGNDAARERLMFRRIVTADSPLRDGIPNYDPLQAECVFAAILSGTPWNPNEECSPNIAETISEEAPEAPDEDALLAILQQRHNNN